MKVDKLPTNVQNIKKNDSISDSLGKIYVLMKEIERFNKEESELKKISSKKEENDKEKRRHKEFVEALQNIKKKQAKPEKVVEKKTKTKEKKVDVAEKAEIGRAHV